MRFALILTGVFFVAVWIFFFWFSRSAILIPLSITCPCTLVVRSRVADASRQSLTVMSGNYLFSVVVPSVPVVSVSDVLVIDGRFEAYDFDDPYHRSDLAHGVRGAFTNVSITAHIPPADLTFLRSIAFFQMQILERLQAVLPFPESAFALGILIGEQEIFPSVLRSAFRATGLSHIVAVSGTNVTILLLFLQPFFLFFPRGLRFWVSGLCVLFFVFVAGADPPVVRAGIMGVIGLFAIAQTRPLHIGRVLFFVFCIMAFWNPLQVVYDVSFQLSFAATAGLIFLSPWIERRLLFFIRSSYIRKSAAVALSAQCTTLPFSLFVFHQVSWIAPVVNIIVEPIVPIAMCLTILFLILSVFLPWLSFLISALLYSFLHLFLQGVLFFGQLPFVAFTW